jgi:hypothetical protein
MSLVGYEYDDTSSTPKKKKEKQKPLKRASTSLVEYHLPEDSNEFHETTTGHDSEVIIENQNHEDEEDESEEEEDTQESPLEDPFADNDIGLKSESFSSVKSPDFSGLKSSDYSGLKNSDFSVKSSESFSVLRVSDTVLSPKAESPSKRQKTIDYSDWKNDYEGPLEPPCPLLVDKVAEYIDYKRTGTNINREYRRKKEFKNPNILEKLVHYYNINETGSNYPTDKFDPHKWKPTSFYDVLAEEQQKCYEKFEKERKEAKTTSKHKSSSKISSSKNHKKSNSNSFY